MREMYKEICNELVKQRTRMQSDDLKILKLELEKESNRLVKARALLLNNNLEPSDYKTIKTNCEINIAKL